MEKERFYVVQSSFRDVGVLDASDADLSFQGIDRTVREDFVQQPETAVAVGFPVLVESGDPAAFLAPVLEIVKAVIQ